MNVFLWILQVVLVVLALSGGAYKVFMVEELMKMPATSSLSPGVWAVLGVFEMLCAVLLVAPALLKRMPILTPIAAAALALESLGLAIMYSKYSLELTAANPLVWVVAIMLMSAVVACGRYACRSSA
jgi:hypothetical protein